MTMPAATSLPLPNLALLLTPERKQEALLALDYLRRLVEALPERRHCVACDRFMGATNPWCNHWGAEVPAEAQAHGCDQWVPSIPF